MTASLRYINGEVGFERPHDHIPFPSRNAPGLTASNDCADQAL